MKQNNKTNALVERLSFDPNSYKHTVSYDKFYAFHTAVGSLVGKMKNNGLQVEVGDMKRHDEMERFREDIYTFDNGYTIVEGADWYSENNCIGWYRVINPQGEEIYKISDQPDLNPAIIDGYEDNYGNSWYDCLEIIDNRIRLDKLV